MSCSEECQLWGAEEVPYELRKKRDILICGESPGKEEEKAKRPFVGRAGQLLVNLMSEAGITRNETSLINAARCRLPMDIKNVDSRVLPILKACRPNVEHAIKIAKPKIIIALGGIALRQIEPGKRGIKKHEGTLFASSHFPGTWVMPAYHPAYCLRNPSMQPRLLDALRQVVELRARGWSQATTKGEYKEVQSIAKLLEERPKLVAIDTETQGLNWMDENCVMLSYSVSWHSGKAWTVVFLQETNKAGDLFIRTDRKHGRSKESTEVIIEKADNFETKLNELLDLMAAKDIQKAMMNGNFDVHFIRAFAKRFSSRKFKLGGYIMDVQAAAHVLDENLYTMASLETLQRDFVISHRPKPRGVRRIRGAPVYDGLRYDDYSTRFAQDFDKFDMIKALNDDHERFVEYACKDADVTRRVGKTIQKKLNGRLQNYYERFVHPTLATLRLMEKHGALINLKALPKTKDAIANDMISLEKKCIRAVPEAIIRRHKEKGLQLTRRDFVKDVVFGADGFDLEPIEETPTGQPKLDKDSRKLLMEEAIGRKARNFLKNYEAWSESHTMFTRYLTGFENAICPDKRIHTRYSLVVAKTGRVASSSPNLMNLPKRTVSAERIRRLIKAPKGKILLAADASQSELRWLAHVANEPNMIKVFRKNDDIHAATARALKPDYDSLPQKEKDNWRFQAKSCNFGLIYMMSPNGFQSYAKINYDLDLDDDDVEDWIESFFDMYPRIEEYHAETIESCGKLGYVESPFGRRRRLPEIFSQDYGVANYAQRQAVNHPIQSASSDCVLLSLNEMKRKRLFKKLRFKPILFIHDELIFEVPDDDKTISRVWEAVKHEMENPPLQKLFGIKMRVPLKSDCKIGLNLANMRPM